MGYQDKFEYCDKLCHPDLVSWDLWDGNQTVTHNSYDGWRSIYSKNMISTGTMSSLVLKWEISLKGKSSNGAITMGIMDGKHIRKANIANFIGSQQHQMGIMIAKSIGAHRYTNGDLSGRIRSNGVKWNIGDRLRLDFDLAGRRCTVFLNDQFVGILTDDLPDTFYLAMSAKWKDTKLETTMFEFV